jgi:hypothetical protein
MKQLNAGRLVRLAAAGLAGMLAAGLAVVAPAQANDLDLARAKAAITHRIDLRLAALHQFDFTLNHAAHLTDAHRGTLHTLISRDLSGLTALKTKVAGETTADALRADAASMINDYRVFILVGPKVRLTIVGDDETAAIARLTTAHDKLAALVAKAKAGGVDTSAAEQNLADMQAAITKAQGDLAGQIDKLLAIQPGPDAQAINDQVSAVRTALRATRADLRTALAEARQVRDFLRSLHPTPTAS